MLCADWLQHMSVSDRTTVRWWLSPLRANITVSESEAGKGTTVYICYTVSDYRICLVDVTQSVKKIAKKQEESFLSVMPPLQKCCGIRGMMH